LQRAQLGYELASHSRKDFSRQENCPIEHVKDIPWTKYEEICREVQDHFSLRDAILEGCKSA
jgi:hypothetical protein